LHRASRDTRVPLTASDQNLNHHCDVIAFEGLGSTREPHRLRLWFASLRYEEEKHPDDNEHECCGKA